MRDDQYTALRRQVLSLGLTGAIAGTAGCSGMVNVERGGESEPEPDDTGEPSTDIDAASFTFEYDAEAQQVEIVFNGGAGITAEDLQLQHTSGKQVSWAELGSTTAAPDEEISQGATAVLGPNVLNWELAVAEDEMIRLIYVGQETPATLERYSPPEPTESESTVPASISSFSIASQSDQRLAVSFISSKQLETITVSVFGPEDTTLTESDFTESQTGDGNYTYEASYGITSDGEFEATLDDAVDVNGNGGLNGQSISDATGISSADTSPPSISAFSIANPSEQRLRVSFDSSKRLATIRVDISGAQSMSLTETKFSGAETSSGQYTYEATVETNSTGNFTATLLQAADGNGTEGANNQSVTVSVEEPTGQEKPITVMYGSPNVMFVGNSAMVNLTVANNSSSQETTVLNLKLLTVDEYKEITLDSNESRDVTFEISVPDSVGTFDATVTDSVGGTETTESVEIYHPSEHYTVTLEREGFGCDFSGVDRLGWRLVVNSELENQPVNDLTLDILFLDNKGRQIGSAVVSGEPPTAGQPVLWDMSSNSINWDTVESDHCAYVGDIATDLDEGGSVKIRTSTDSTNSTVTAESVKNNPSEYYTVTLERDGFGCDYSGVDRLGWRLVVKSELETQPLKTQTVDIVFLDSEGRQIGSAVVSGEPPTAGQPVLWDMGSNSINWDTVESDHCAYMGDIATDLDEGGSVRIA